MSKIINNIELLNGFNINPVPLEFSQSMTTTKILASLQSTINNIIDLCNKASSDAQTYTDSQIDLVEIAINNLVDQLQNGDIIKDGSIQLSKLNNTFFNDLQNTVINYLQNSSTFVTFGLDDNGHFISYMPSSWSDIIFSTNSDGYLVLSIREE